MKHLKILSPALLSLMTASCGVQSEFLATLNESPSDRTNTNIQIDPNDPFLKYSEQEIIEMFSGTSCNSFGGGQSITGSGVDFTQGLRGRVKSAPAGLTMATAGEWFNLNRFDQPDAVSVPGQVFFNRLNVPTRLFSTGFPTLGGGLLQGPTGSPLVEFFRIDFDGQIQVGPEEFGENEYEFAAIADDGVIMKIDGQTVINDPLVTPPKLMCGTQRMFMAPEEPLSFELAYSQAPRYHIALVLLWRKVVPGLQPEPMCGFNGIPGPTFEAITGAWFDWTQPNSPPTANYNNLLNRGWSVLKAENFQVPSGVDFNPCSSTYVQSVFANQ
jgi:hypothetical protein